MILTLKELAETLKVTERTVMRMLQSGQLRGVKIGGQWRFNGSEIDRLFFPDSEGAAAATGEDAVSLTDLVRRDIHIPISRVMNEKRIILDLEASKRDDVINALAAILMRDGLILDVTELRRRLLDREKLLSTGIGNGVAIPHPRDPLTELNASAVIVLARCPNGVKYNALDGKPVKLFFMLCCENIEMHLHMMGQLARLLQDEQVIPELLAAETEQAALRVIMQHEQATMLDA